MHTIALVDDDRNILASVSIAFETEGYRIVTYADGASALDGFKTSPPDLAIFDIKMPRMDGIELLRRVREKSNLPVIFLTSKEGEIDELFGLKMGADDFVRKPFSHGVLLSAQRPSFAAGPLRKTPLRTTPKSRGSSEATSEWIPSAITAVGRTSPSP